MSPGEATELATSSGVYYLDLTATEMTADQIAGLVKSTEGIQTVFVLEPEPAQDSGVAQAGDTSSITLRSAASGSDDQFNAAEIEIVRGTGAGQSRTITNYVGSSKVVTVDRDWVTSPGSDSVYVIHPRIGARMQTSIATVCDVDEIDNVTAAATNLAKLYKGCLVGGSVSDSTPTTTSFNLSSDFGTTDDQYNNQILVVVSGDQLGQARKISDYAGSARTLTLETALPAAPANGDEVVIISIVT